ncbi:MAG: hypothetical protein ACRDBQ_10255 [Shewanella sp.]
MCNNHRRHFGGGVIDADHHYYPVVTVNGGARCGLGNGDDGLS